MHKLSHEIIKRHQMKYERDHIRTLESKCRNRRFKKSKRITRIWGHSLAASLEPLAHHRNVASLSLFYRYYFGRCSSDLAQLVPLPYSRGRSTRCSDRLHNFSVTIPRCYKDVYVKSFFPCLARLWNYLPIECFPLTYVLCSWSESQLKNRHDTERKKDWLERRTVNISTAKLNRPN